MHAYYNLNSMKPVKGLALLLLLIGILFLVAQYRQRVLDNKSQLSPTPLATPAATNATSSGEIKTEVLAQATSSPLATPKPTSTFRPTAAPTAASAPTGLNVDRFIYPGSSVKSKSTLSLTLNSESDPDAITNWFKDQLSALGFNTTSFVMTKTNINVLNKLVVAKNNTQVSVDIKKSASAAQSEITVEIKNDWAFKWLPIGLFALFDNYGSTNFEV